MLVDRLLADRQSRAAVELEFKRRRSKRVLHRGQSGGSLHSSWASSSSLPAFLSPVTSEIDRGRAISESRHGGTTCVHCRRYTCQRLLYIWHRRSKCPALQAGDREPVISSASQPLTCMYGLLIYQGYGSHPTLPPTIRLSPHFHGAPDRSVMFSESIFTGILLPSPQASNPRLSNFPRIAFFA